MGVIINSIDDDKTFRAVRNAVSHMNIAPKNKDGVVDSIIIRDRCTRNSPVHKQLKQKQKAKISDYMYLETQAFRLANQRMPSTDSEWQAVAQKVYDHIASFHVTYEEVCSVYLKKLPHIIERLEADGLPGHIRSHAEVKELQRVRAAKKAGNPRKKRAKKAAKAEPLEQDDTFFFIAGYTSGGAPYGVTWEEMGMESWDDLQHMLVELPHLGKSPFHEELEAFMPWVPDIQENCKIPKSDAYVNIYLE